VVVDASRNDESRDAVIGAVGITIEHYSQTATSKAIEMLVPQDLLTA